MIGCVAYFVSFLIHSGHFHMFDVALSAKLVIFSEMAAIGNEERLGAEC